MCMSMNVSAISRHATRRFTLYGSAEHGNIFVRRIYEVFANARCKRVQWPLSEDVSHRVTQCSIVQKIFQYMLVFDWSISNTFGQVHGRRYVQYDYTWIVVAY